MTKTKIKPKGQPSVLLMILTLAIIGGCGVFAARMLEQTGPGCYAYVELNDDQTWEPGPLVGNGEKIKNWDADRYGARPELNGRDCTVRVEDH